MRRGRLPIAGAETYGIRGGEALRWASASEPQKGSPKKGNKGHSESRSALRKGLHLTAGATVRKGATRTPFHRRKTSFPRRETPPQQQCANRIRPSPPSSPPQQQYANRIRRSPSSSPPLLDLFFSSTAPAPQLFSRAFFVRQPWQRMPRRWMSGGATCGPCALRCASSARTICSSLRR